MAPPSGKSIHLSWSLMPHFPKAFFYSVTNLMFPLPQTPFHGIIKICNAATGSAAPVTEASTSGSPLPAQLCLGPQIPGIGDWGF